MNKSIVQLIFVTLLILSTVLKAQALVDVAVRGVSDNKRDGEQKDRQEAIMDAKRQALEKAGLRLKATTKVENFQTTYDYIETQAETVLMPGFQIIDNGYGLDGTYSVVLVGKVKSTVEEDITYKELRYAKHIFEQNKKSEAKDIITKLMNDTNTDLAEQAHYLYLKWFLLPYGQSVNEYFDALNKYMNDFEPELDKFKIYYPSSKYISLLSNDMDKYLEEIKIKYKSVFDELKSNMVYVKGGNTGDFYIGKTEITQAQYQAVMGKNPSHFKGENNPVEQVSWYDAVGYCNMLSKMEGLQKCYSGTGSSITCDFEANGYRLPTEAEWMYAAKGGNQSNGYEYSGSNNMDEVGWHGGNSGGKTHAVETKKPNELGIYDMSGNLWEWCWDWYTVGKNRVLRGGSWSNYDDLRNITFRYYDYPSNGCYNIGFRVVRTK